MEATKITQKASSVKEGLDYSRGYLHEENSQKSITVGRAKCVLA
jgi:hypothetical protein